MSLDKFVLRGFTASTGGGCDGWVQKTAQTYSQNTVREPENRGTSFVMGAGRPSSSSASKQVSPSRQSLEAFSSTRNDLHNKGTRGAGPVPRQCFGGGAPTESSPISATLIPAAFFIVSFLGAAYVLINYMGLVPSTRQEQFRETSEADVYRRRQPAWGR